MTSRSVLNYLSDFTTFKFTRLFNFIPSMLGLPLASVLGVDGIVSPYPFDIRCFLGMPCFIKASASGRRLTPSGKRISKGTIANYFHAQQLISEFETKMNVFKTNLDSLFAESKTLEKEIQKQLNGLKYE